MWKNRERKKRLCIEQTLFLYGGDSSVSLPGQKIGGFETAVFGSFGKFGGGGEKDVAGAVECRFARILQYADDEADADDLHGDIVVDTEARAGDGNEEQ